MATVYLAHDVRHDRKVALNMLRPCRPVPDLLAVAIFSRSLEPHDLWISKAIAGRPKDIEFCRALVDGGLVRGERLRKRLGQVKALDPRVRAALAARLAP